VTGTQKKKFFCKKRNFCGLHEKRLEMHWEGALGDWDPKSVEKISFFSFLVELLHFFIFRHLTILGQL
jgi:hypothetical protein